MLGSNEETNIIDSFEDEVDIGKGKLEDRTLQIQQLISHFELRLFGFMWKDSGEKYYYTGKPLMGDSSVQKVMLLLHPFSREVIMISNKKEFQWQKQLLKTRLEVAGLLTKAPDIDVNDFREIWRTFSNLLFNIGDIILHKNSQEFLKGYMGIETEKELRIERRIDRDNGGVI